MPQIIPFVVTAITAVTSAVVAAGPLAVAAFNAANIIGAAALANEAFKAVQPQVKSSSTALEWNADPNAPNRFAFGRVGGAGNIIHNATYGPDKMFVGFVGVMSASGPIKSWQAFKADDAFVSFDASGKAINTEYANEMYLGRQRGLQPEPSYLPSPSGLKNGAAMPRWGASYKLSGKAAYMYTLAENSKRSAFKGKVPTGIHYIEGLYCYDPRFDSTYPGGTGHCRIDDPTTWVYSTNAYIHALNWNIGRWEGEALGFTPKRYGVPYASMKVGGIGATPDGIDFSGYVEAANVFDENAWASAAWPDADQSKAAVLDSFLQAGGGIYAERQGKISCLHRAAPRTSVVTITADDTAGTIEYDTTTSLLERINTIRPEYWSEAHGWQMVATDEVTSDVWREEDGQGVAVTRSKGLAYNYVPQSKQARELSALQIAHTREGIRGTAPLRHYLDLEVGDCFTFEVPEAVLNGQKCIVLNVDPDLENDIINVTFASESDGKYAFAFGQADAPPPAPALQPADNTVSPPLPGDWTITPRPPAPGGGQLPGFDLGGIVSNETATAVIVEYGPTATGPWTQAYQGPPTVTNIPIDGLQPGATYYIAVQYQRDQNYSERYVYGPYTAPLLDPSPTAPTIVDLQGQITTAFGDIFDVSELVGQTRADLEAADAALGSAIGSLDTRADQLETATQTLEANKASVASLNAQIARINDVEAVNATQALALVDLENGKVALSEYNTLKGEVQAARDGAPSLLGQIQNLKSVDLDLQNNKASVASVDALAARTGHTEAGIIDLENALANEATARAESVSQVRAASRHRDNLLPNGGFEGGTSGITARIIVGGVATTLATSVIDGPNGRVLSVGPYGPGLYVIEWPDFSIYGNDDYTLTGDAAIFGIGATDQTYFDLQMTGPSGEDLGGAGDGGQSILSGPRDFSLANRDGYAFTTRTPSGAGRARARYVVNCATSPTLIQLRQVKAERGVLPATAYSDDQAARALSATVTEQSLAIIDLENQQALAAWGVLAEASGADPAFIGVVSSTLGGYVAIAGPVVALQTTTGGQVKTALKAHDGNVHIADKLYLGDDGLWVFDPVTKTESIRGPGFAKVRGRGFGANGDLTEWSGPNIPIGSMTKANGVRWEDVNGNAYFGGNLSAGVLTARDRTSSLSVSASVDTGRYNSHGGAISVTVSLSGGWGKSYYSPTNLAAATETGTVEVSLDRAVNGGAFIDGVAIMSRAYNWTRENQGFEPGLGFLISESGGYSGSLTYTDPQQIAQDRQYRARIITFSPITLAGPPTIQDLGVISVE